MDLEADISIPLPPHQPGYLHESSKLKLIAAGSNGTPVTAVEEAAAAVAAASRSNFAEGPPAAPPAVSPTLTGGTTTSCPANLSKETGSKKPVRYRECQKNHAAGIGGHALDGCGEFMPSGEDGSLEGLKCSACDCHRNFHRREVEGEILQAPDWYRSSVKDGKKKSSASLQNTSPLAAITPSGRPSPGGTLMAVSNSDVSEEQQHDAATAAAVAAAAQHNSAFALAHHLIPAAIRKRFRTKFTNEQKEKMFMFADRLGWKIQKHDEAEVQQFCADVGVKRHVLKVWMHNNKNTFSKKLS